MNTLLISSILVNISAGLLHWPGLVDWLGSGEPTGANLRASGVNANISSVFAAKITEIIIPVDSDGLEPAVKMLIKSFT